MGVKCRRYLRVGLQKLSDPLGLVRREVVRNHMDLPSLRLSGHEVRQEGDELLRRMPLGGLAENFPRLGIERGVQGERAVAIVFKAMPFGPPGRQGQHRILTIQGLNRGLLIDTKHGRMLRRVQVEADDVGRLRLKVRIIGGHIAVQSMRLEPMLSPHPGHPHVTDPELGGELPGTPVSRPVAGVLPRGVQDAGFHLRGLPPG